MGRKNSNGHVLRKRQNSLPKAHFQKRFYGGPLIFIFVFVVVVCKLSLPSKTSTSTIANPPLNEVVTLRNLDLSSNKFVAYRMTSTFPHDARAFTQGFFVDGDKFIESTGLWGRSSLRVVDKTTGTVEKILDLPKDQFGEGVTAFGNEYIMLTWKDNIAYRINKDTFSITTTMPFETTTGEGWGITSDGTDLIVSDGSSTILFLDPVTLKEKRRIQVQESGKSIKNLNELEYVDGMIYANVWMTYLIVCIDPKNGNVGSILDYSFLSSHITPSSSSDQCMNGIAYDHNTTTLYLTGKLWDKVITFQHKSKI